MNILYLGKFYPSKLLTSIVENSKGQMVFPNHNFEMSIINGLSLQEFKKAICISIPNVYSYPHNYKKLFTSSETYYENNLKIHSVGFCNLVLVKEIWSTLSLVYRLLRCLRLYDGKRVDIILNTPSVRHLVAIQIAKFFCRKQITQTVIIPDIPSFVNSMDKCNYLKRVLLQYFDNFSISLTSKSNGLVLLSNAMLEFFNRNIKHIVMEGVIDLNKLKVPTQHNSGVQENSKVVLYTGTLRRIFGVMNLVEAFKYVMDKDAELWLCGAGDAKDDIIEASKTDKRIKYLGVVDSTTAIELQNKATILVNPRTSEGEFTKYSFPSKTIEYMLSGKPVILNPLPGIPKEYLDYVYVPKDESVLSLSNCISEVLNMDYELRMARAESARNFIIENKNSYIQVKRIIDLISTY